MTTVNFNRLFHSANAFIATPFSQVSAISSANVAAKSQPAMHISNKITEKSFSNNYKWSQKNIMNITLTVHI